MLSALLSFVQTMQSDRPRQRQELRSLITSIADDQADMGRNVVVEDGPEIVLVGDHLGLRSLFTNLIDNAVTYGGGACIRLRQQGPEAIVEIDDDGLGLPQEGAGAGVRAVLPVRTLPQPQDGGMGLGLALVRSVAVAHGGRASAREPGRSRVARRVHLPCIGARRGSGRRRDRVRAQDLPGGTRRQCREQAAWHDGHHGATSRSRRRGALFVTGAGCSQLAAGFRVRR